MKDESPQALRRIKVMTRPTVLMSGPQVRLVAGVGDTDIGYHSSPTGNRQSIRQHGLNPDCSDAWGYDARLGRPYPWTWLTTSLEAAKEFCPGNKNDIWQVCLEGIKVQDDPHGWRFSSGKSIATAEHIPPACLLLL